MTVRSVAFYMHDLSGGGVERMRLALIAELRVRGLQVTLVVGRRHGALRDLVPADLAVVELGCQGMLRAVRPLADVLAKLRPDLLVASLDHNNVTAMLAGWLSRAGTRVVICQHNALSAERVSGWRYRAVPWLYWLLQTRAHGMVAVSRGVADDMASVAGIDRRRITPIYNPVVSDDLARRAAGDAPHPWLADGGAEVLVFAGRLTAQKDPALLLDALALLVTRRDVRLIMLGEGPLLPALRDQVHRLGLDARVAFAGFAANPLPWIAHAACLVLPSRYEGLGNVLIEALACGTPVVATDCPHGPAEILLGGQLGPLVPVGDAPAMAAAIAKVLDTPPDRAALQARAAAFTAAACADAHEALFARIMAKPLRATGSLVPGQRASNRCAPSPRAPIGGAPSPRAPGPRAPGPRAPSPRAPGPRAPGGRAFGLGLSPCTAGEIVARLVGEVVHDLRLVVTPNIDHLRLLRRQAFADAYAGAHLICPDGFPVLLYARLRGLRLKARVTGCDLFAKLADHDGLRGKRVLVVAESRAMENAVRAWGEGRSLHGLRVLTAPDRLGTDKAAQGQLAHRIAVEAPDILVMTLGAPVSEVFIHTHRPSLPPCWALCVGQAVRVHLGLVERAPARWQRLGLEWLWRIRQEPRRLAGRYVRDVAWFPAAVAADLWRQG